jgi:hypothetical protein
MFLLLKLTKIILPKSVLTVVSILGRSFYLNENTTALNVVIKLIGMLLRRRLSETVVLKMRCSAVLGGTPKIALHQDALGHGVFKNACGDGLAGAVMSSQESVKQEILNASLRITVALAR